MSHSRAALLPGIALAAALLAALSLAFVVDVATACRALAGLLVVAAVLRALLLDRDLVGGRSRAVDVALLLLLAAALLYLAPWGNVPRVD